MEITVQRNADAVIGALTGRLDTLTAPEFDRWFFAQMQAGERRIILDLAKLEYISSAGLRSLLAAAKQTNAAGGTIILCSLCNTVSDIFNMSGFMSIFRVVKTVDEASVALD